MSFHKKVYSGNADEAEARLIKKLYRKQWSLFNKGLGPKPNMDDLIKKSRLRNVSYIEKTPIEIPNPKLIKKEPSKLPIRVNTDFVDEIKDTPGFYIIQFEHGLKFGISKNMAGRMIEYTKPWVRPILKAVFLYTHYGVARNIETELIRRFETRYSQGSIEFLTETKLEELIETLKKFILA